jgi:hypothetical protein
MPSYPLGDWDFLTTVPADCEGVYAAVVPTLADSSVAEGMYQTTFFVRARTAVSGVYFDSPPDSGYSVDNLSPEAPGGLELIAAHTVAWRRNLEEDMDYYSVYVSEDSSTSLESADFVGHTIDTCFVLSDTTSGYYVLVTATDFAGNESGASDVVWNCTGVRGTPPTRYFLAQNVPNPFNPTTSIKFGVPEAGPVILSIHGVDGRQVACLVDGRYEPGVYVKAWDGRDDNGREVSSGVYFARMEAADFRASCKMLLLR